VRREKRGAVRQCRTAQGGRAEWGATSGRKQDTGSAGSRR
jgi:hypothetical protein